MCFRDTHAGGSERASALASGKAVMVEEALVFVELTPGEATSVETGR